jgi:Caspase domain
VTSTERATTFQFSGVGAGHDLVLPPTNVAKVLFPAGEITITARAPCYAKIVNHVQIAEQDDDKELDFNFTNAERKPGCEEPATHSREPAISEPSLSQKSAKLAWVITNSTYGGDWPQLSFVDNDQASMNAVLSRAGYRAIDSHNRSKQQLLTDETMVQQALTQQNWSSVIVYISSHGMGLGGRNYIVPADAPASNSAGPSDLFDIDRIKQDLRPLWNSGVFAIILVDACRSNADTRLRPFLAVHDEGTLVNFSASPGSVSFDGEDGMSGWTERFVALAQTVPWLGTDQLVLYATDIRSGSRPPHRRFRGPSFMAGSPPECHHSVPSRPLT